MLKFLIPLLSFYLFLVVVVFLIQDKLLFFPDNTPLKNCPMTNGFSAKIESIDYKNHRLNFYIRENANANAWLLHFHGNAGRACDRDFVFGELYKLPLNLVIMEYPGYSGDKTKKSQKTFLENASTAMDYFKEQKDLPFFLFGESLGTGIVTYLATKYDVKGLILQSPYPSLGEVGEKAYPFLPVSLLLRNNFPAKKWAPDVRTKVLLLHGEEDNIIPLSLGRKQAENFPVGYDFQSFKGRGHNDLTPNNDDLWDKVRSFIKQD